MATSLPSSARSFIWQRVKKSHGLTKLFWLIVLAAGTIVPILGVERTKHILQTEVVARVKQMFPGGGPDVAASIPGGDASSPIRVYFTTIQLPAEQSAIAKAVVGYVDQTQRTLDVCAFELNNKVICDAIVRAAKRNVKVRCVTETDYLKDTEYGIKALKEINVPIVDDKRPGALMHDKFMIFDGAAVWTGSMNFTENCAYKNNNNGIYFDDRNLAANYETKFNWMFDKHKFGSAPSHTDKIPNPIVTLRDGTVVENYFATHDKVASHVIDAVDASTRSLHFLAFSFTHDGISKAMLTRARANVEVKGVFEKSETHNNYSEFARMGKAGPPVEVYTDGNPPHEHHLLHHKVIVIDGKKTIAGSFNFSTNADKSNDENLVIIHSPEVSKLFEEEFQRNFGAAKKMNGGGALTMVDWQLPTR
jgi:phosphatidylserine/phosphatidylglycerophosphate/cardiolipin synthase-like enzyme